MAFLLVFLLHSCANREDDHPRQEALFKLLSPEQTGVAFSNAIVEDDTANLVDFFYVYNGGGVAVGDLNNDSLLDVFFTGNQVRDALYLNTGSEPLQFEDISESAGVASSGWSTGVTMVDINSDGWLDIYVCRSGNYPANRRKNKLFINNGTEEGSKRPTFTEAAASYGLADTSYSTQAAFLDYDKDGDLDMYLLNHTNAIRNPNEVRPLVSDGSGPANDRLYRNDGVGPNQHPTFTNVSQKAGIRYDGLGLGVGISDVNEDGWDDLYITNDFLANDYLYLNQQDGTFAEVASTYFGHTSHFSMGHDIADFNNDGLSDIITLDMLPPDNLHRKKMSGPMNYNLFAYTRQMGYMPQYMRNTVQLNLGRVGKQHRFAEIGQLLGLHATNWSWAPLVADFDNDGWKDVFISNGYLRDITDLDFINYTAGVSSKITADSLDHVLREKARQMPSIELPNVVFKNKSNLHFEDASAPWGIDQPSLSNGAAYGDLDNDGDLDLVVNNMNKPAFIYENQINRISENNFLKVRLVGDRLNLSGIGAKVSVYIAGMHQMAEQSATRGYQSSVDPVLQFGLGTHNRIDSLRVQWPDGTVSDIKDVAANQRLVVRHADARLPTGRTSGYSAPWFTEVTEALGIAYQHTDPEYNDFSRQHLLPHKLSEQGPGIAVGDVNGDKLSDFFVGGAYEHSGHFFLQQPNGTFQKKKLTRQEKYEEDLGVLLFDYDNDGDLDLYVASGSNEHFSGSEYYQDRLYANDGIGNFTLTRRVLPALRVSSSCVRAADVDQDGDLDLFVGGRSIPLKYPLPPDSYLLINEGGTFVDKTPESAPGLRRVGMVKDALWTDFDNDLDTDLIVVGEFMPIQFFRNTRGRLENISDQVGLTHTAGWWNSINGGDFDQDGDIDYVLGNVGLNTAYPVSRDEPMTIYAADLDQNGFIDPIITAYLDHQESPIHTRDDLIRQVPPLKKKFADYASYAEADVSDILTPADRSRAYTAKAFRFASSYLENTGNGHFRLSALPRQAQWAPVYGILVHDIDQDGFLDVLLAGNDFGTETTSGRYDASVGTVLQGDGEGGFRTISPAASGLATQENLRGAAVLQKKEAWICLFANNSGPLQAYTATQSTGNEIAIPIPGDVTKAKIVFKDGSQRLQEFYYGSSYLSQSARALMLTGKEVRIYLYNSEGKEEEIIL